MSIRTRPMIAFLALVLLSVVLEYLKSPEPTPSR